MFHLVMSFRPLDGESISKPTNIVESGNSWYGFRPLDGESISKPTYANS